MKLLIKTTFTVIAIIFMANTGFSQDRFDNLRKRLDSLSQNEAKGLKQKVELSVTGVSIQEFIRGLATAHKLNVSVDPGIKTYIVNNFSDATVADVFIFLCKQYDLKITFIGSIMSFTKYVPPPVQHVAYVPKDLKIEYNQETDFLSLDLKKDSLDQIAKEITKQSFKNVVLAPGLEDRLINVYIQNRPFLNALEKMAFANNLEVTETEDNFYLIEEKKADPKQANNRRGNERNKRGLSATMNNDLVFNVDVSEENELITVHAVNVPVIHLIQDVSAKLFKSFFLFSEPQGNTSLYIENATYDQFMTYLLNGSDYTYKKEDKVYLIGERKLERLRKTEMVQLRNRTVESIIDFIPAELKKDLEIQEFTELNSLVLSGSLPKIEEIKSFVRQIDRVVPVVLIEVMIVDANTSRTVSTGISAGIGGEPKTTEGTINPGVDITLDAGSVNELINSFNGYGIFNLGRVTPDFYLSIKALEDQGILKKRSTPQLATINGHEATMSIGNTEYYLEVSNNVIGTQNPQNIITQTYKSVQADMSITIKPIVSGDEQITMEIAVEQSDFTSRVSPNAPPGTVSRSFKSLIRVKNQEMILLGGLEEQSKNQTGTGLPLLQRIPIIRWLFSNRTHTKSKSKLNIFIKPTILY